MASRMKSQSEECGDDLSSGLKRNVTDGSGVAVRGVVNKEAGAGAHYADAGAASDSSISAVIDSAAGACI